MVRIWDFRERVVLTMSKTIIITNEFEVGSYGSNIIDRILLLLT